MKIATWNVNSIRVRLPHLTSWIDSQLPDLVAIQETKVEDCDFPIAALEKIGYAAFFSGQKSYNGVAIIYKKSSDLKKIEGPHFPDSQKRFLAVNFLGIDLINIYVPNGNSVGSDKYQYKMDWLLVLQNWIAKRLKENKNMIVMGDFNIAPEDIDVHDVDMWKDKILCSKLERDAFNKIINLGFCDAYRSLHMKDKSFTWWDYRLNGFKRNLGLRIDHILVSTSISNSIKNVGIEKSLREMDRPSDHALVFAELDA